MKCPHCTTTIHSNWIMTTFRADQDGVFPVDGTDWAVIAQRCPACKEVIVKLVSGNYVASRGRFTPEANYSLVHPRSSQRPKPSQHVPRDLAKDFQEACLVLDDSPKASAALSRRCLQSLIREHANIVKRNLAQEIDALIESNTLPPYLLEQIDGVRNIGNLAAHPTRSEVTGQILDVEDGEAEWLLDTLEALFQFYFVHKAEIEAKRAALNAKLDEAGQPPMK